MRKLIPFVCSLLLICCLSACKDKTLKLNHPKNIRGVISFKRSFSDLNDLQLSVAQKIGIKPASSREQVEKMKGRLVHIEDNEYYVVDSLTHSLPYLIPKASNLLSSLGSNFLDSLGAKGLNPYKIVVTSVLRTLDDVRKLRHHNGNASEKSAHFYGTTFDVSWKHFEKVEEDRPMQDVNKDTLKLVLSEVLRDLRKAETCYAKYELKQGCFHITAR
ncbi:DUF5715 family protein [uncultured Bacteroides sp.]|uniref:DUF5715 family protein n=1 Tax=uncultured Bacteroides sp. TaxID=162156 RepID=UPI002AAAA7DE|nr:DUF5715 family protein [uncultured Bacteroides sp.]